MSDKSDNDQSDLLIEEQVRNAFAIHALNQSVGGRFRNETPNLGQKPRLKLTQRPRTRISGHKASLWLTNYDFASFLDLARALTLHEQQTFGYSGKSKLEFIVDIKTGNEPMKSVKIVEKTPHGKKAYEQKVLPVINDHDPTRTSIRVRTEKLTCGFVCDCFDAGELEFEAPDYGSLRVFIDWNRWQRDPVSNSLVFENSFLDPIFLPAAFADRKHFDIQLPDDQNFRIRRSEDPSVKPSLTEDVQEALSHVAAGVTRENIKQNKIRISIAKDFPDGPSLSRPQESPSQISPSKTSPKTRNIHHIHTLDLGQARADGIVFVHRPARTTSYKYDAPYTIARFLALARANLYPDTPVNNLRIMISPNTAAREKGMLLTPIAEVEKGYREPDKVGKTLEDYWEDEYMDAWFNPYEDVWAIKVFVSTTTSNSRLSTADTYGLGKEIDQSVRWHSKDHCTRAVGHECTQQREGNTKFEGRVDRSPNHAHE